MDAFLDSRLTDSDWQDPESCALQAHQPVWNGADAATCRHELKHYLRRLDITVIAWPAPETVSHALQKFD
jgi:hypothetical protein